MPHLRLLLASGGKFLIRSLAISALALVVSQETNAATTVTIDEGTDTASRVVKSESGNYTVYGGVAGTCSGSTSSSSICNSCSTTVLGDQGFIVCNRRRIHPDLTFEMQVTSDSIATGTPMVTINEEAAAPITLVSSSTVSKGNTATIQIKWSEICGVLGDNIDNTCIPTAAKTTANLRVGIDDDGADSDDKLSGDEYKLVAFTVLWVDDSDTSPADGVQDNAVQADCDNATLGICDFDIISGDKKGSLSNLTSNSGFPTTGDLMGVRVFYHKRDDEATGSWDQMNVETDSKELTISGQDPPELTPKSVTGLTNGEVYDFRIGMIDAAYNEYSYTQEADAKICANGDSSNNQVTGEPECKTARPSDVVALLNEEVNCFIATATYGSPMAKEVGTFRKFRAKFLVPSEIGRKFIKFYYVEGKKLARFISKSEALRTISRALLYPVLIFATIALQYGGTTALLFSLAGVALLIGSIAIARRYARRLSA